LVIILVHILSSWGAALESQLSKLLHHAEIAIVSNSHRLLIIK
jgi:hypothetical protein